MKTGKRNHQCLARLQAMAKCLRRVCLRAHHGLVTKFLLVGAYVIVGDFCKTSLANLTYWLMFKLLIIFYDTENFIQMIKTDCNKMYFEVENSLYL